MIGFGLTPSLPYPHSQRHHFHFNCNSQFCEGCGVLFHIFLTLSQQDLISWKLSWKKISSQFIKTKQPHSVIPHWLPNKDKMPDSQTLYAMSDAWHICWKRCPLYGKSPSTRIQHHQSSFIPLIILFSPIQSLKGRCTACFVLPVADVRMFISTP